MGDYGEPFDSTPFFYQPHLPSFPAEEDRRQQYSSYHQVADEGQRYGGYPQGQTTQNRRNQDEDTGSDRGHGKENIPAAMPSSTSSTTSQLPSTGNPTSSSGVVMRKSCQHCRKRKIRCIPSENDEQVCKACSNKGQPCVFEKQSVMGRPPKNKQKDKEQPPAGSTNPSTADSSSSSPTKASNSKNARKTSIPGGGPENNGATKPNQAEPDADADVDMKRPQTAASGASVGGNARPATSEGQRPPKRKKKNSVSATKKEGEKQPDSDLSRSGATTLPPAVHLADPSKSGLPAFSGQASSSSSSSSSPSSSAHSHYHQQHYTLSGNHQEPYGGHKSTAASVNANGHPPHQEQQHYGSYNTQFLPPLTSLPGYRPLPGAAAFFPSGAGHSLYPEASQPQQQHQQPQQQHLYPTHFPYAHQHAQPISPYWQPPPLHQPLHHHVPQYTPPPLSLSDPHFHAHQTHHHAPAVASQPGASSVYDFVSTSDVRHNNALSTAFTSTPTTAEVQLPPNSSSMHNPAIPTNTLSTHPTAPDTGRPSSQGPPLAASAADASPASAGKGSGIIHPPMPGFSTSQRIQMDGDAYNSFVQDTLFTMVVAIYDLLAPKLPDGPTSSIPYTLTDSSIAPIAKIRTLAGKAFSSRRPQERGQERASAAYARSLIAPVWEGVAIDIIALVTTGKPTSCAPFNMAALDSPSSSGGRNTDANLFSKLLREDESVSFSLTRVRETSPSTSNSSSSSDAQKSPYKQYAPTKAHVLKYFQGYFAKHPLAPLIINEKLFTQDLEADKVDDVLVNIIVGSAIARAPCLTEQGGPDATDIGDLFFDYIQEQMLARPVSDSLKLETCQCLILWGCHELTHMRARRAASLFTAADVLLRERLKRFQAKAAAASGKDATMSDAQPAPSWREVVEHELTINALWVLVVVNSWIGLSLNLPNTTMSIYTACLPPPPSSVQLSSSFAFAYGANSPIAINERQPIVRGVIERFSDMTQLISVLGALKSPKQAKNLFAPDPARPLAIVAEGDEAYVAKWLLDLAKYHKHSATPDSSLATSAGEANDTMQLVKTDKKATDESKAFLVVAHAILALYQLLPFTTYNTNESGVPIPLPTFESLRTALQALHLLSQSIATSSATLNPTRSQALLLDAMPRITALLDLFSSTALNSLDHFILVTSNRHTVRELLFDLGRACSTFAPYSMTGLDLTSVSSIVNWTASHALPHANFDRASQALQAIADIGQEASAITNPSITSATTPTTRWIGDGSDASFFEHIMNSHPSEYVSGMSGHAQPQETGPTPWQPNSTESRSTVLPDFGFGGVIPDPASSASGSSGNENELATNLHGYNNAASTPAHFAAQQQPLSSASIAGTRLHEYSF